MDTRDAHVPMDSPERCQLTELIKSQCAHCRPPAPTFTEALFVTSNDDEDAIIATFPARWDGRCAQCDSFFESGDWVSRTRTGNYLCSECVEP